MSDVEFADDAFNRGPLHAMPEPVEAANRDVTIHDLGAGDCVRR